MIASFKLLNRNQMQSASQCDQIYVIILKNSSLTCSVILLLRDTLVCGPCGFPFCHPKGGFNIVLKWCHCPTVITVTHTERVLIL